MRMCEIMSEVPTIMIIKARTGHQWMNEELQERIEELKPIIDALEASIIKAGDNEDMAPISFIWFIAKEL